MNTTTNEAGLETIAATMRAMGYAEAAVAKVLKVLENRAPSRACAYTRADTPYKNTNSSGEICEDGRMLRLDEKQPPKWVELMIRAGLKARGLGEELWGRAWEWFRSWNIDSKGNRRIAARALKGWLKKAKLEAQPKAKVVVAQPTPAAQPVGEGVRERMELASHAPSSESTRHQTKLESLLGKDGYENRVRAMQARFGCGVFAAKAAVHGEAVKLGEISV
jgi:hypothetical protein